MPKNPSEYTEGLGAIQEQYRQSLPERFQELSRVWRELDASKWDASAFHTFVRLTHRLAGSGGSYGFAPVSEAAHRLEVYARSVDGAHALSSAECAQIVKYLKQLGKVVNETQKR